MSKQPHQFAPVRAGHPAPLMAAIADARDWWFNEAFHSCKDLYLCMDRETFRAFARELRPMLQGGENFEEECRRVSEMPGATGMKYLDMKVWVLPYMQGFIIQEEAPQL